MTQNTKLVEVTFAMLEATYKERKNMKDTRTGSTGGESVTIIFNKERTEVYLDRWALTVERPGVMTHFEIVEENTMKIGESSTDARILAVVNDFNERVHVLM